MLFSVIVPIYKVEKYLKRCIDSVLCQTYEDFELILVDDGSPDGCPALCDAYAQKDKRVRVIHKENGGLVSARQAGIREATGDYVFNLDGDDAIAENALFCAYEIIRDTAADLVSFSYQIYENGVLGKIENDLAEEGLYQKEEIEKHIYPKLLSDENMTHIFYFLWGKAIRRSLLYDNQLNVNPAISLGEDLSCVVPCYLQADTVYMSRTSVYYYTIRNDSISTSFNTKQITQIADVIHGLRKLDISKSDDFDEQIARYSCFMCFAILAAAAEGGHNGALPEIKRLMLSTVHKEEMPKAKFRHLSKKSKIGIFFLQRFHIKTAFYFLFVCKKIKQFLKKER